MMLIIVYRDYVDALAYQLSAHNVYTVLGLSAYCPQNNDAKK